MERFRDFGGKGSNFYGGDNFADFKLDPLPETADITPEQVIGEDAAEITAVDSDPIAPEADVSSAS